MVINSLLAPVLGARQLVVLNEDEAESQNAKYLDRLYLMESDQAVLRSFP
jgi:hypothetical protein